MNATVRTTRTVVMVFVALLFGVLLGANFFAAPAPTTRAFSSDAAVQPAFIGGTILQEQERVFREIYDLVAPSVVSLHVTVQRGSGGMPSFGDASGSGFVIDTQGHIVTNFHVVQGGTRIEVRFFDGTIKAARVVGTDPDSDLAVVKVDNVPVERLRPVVFANSDNLAVGQTVLALGNPFDNEWTLTSGIISALNRRIVGLGNYSIGGVIQTDAAINPGNSGGPLVNLNGEVVGVNSQIESGSRSNSGIGFAVPSNLVSKVARALINEGRVRYSFIGISSRPIDLDLMEQFNLPDNLRGVAVLQVQQGFPAERAGLRSLSNNAVDVITAINGKPIKDFDELIGWLAIHTNPGDTITLSVYRGGRTLEIPLTLVERPRSSQ